MRKRFLWVLTKKYLSWLMWCLENHYYRRCRRKHNSLEVPLVIWLPSIIWRRKQEVWKHCRRFYLKSNTADCISRKKYEQNGSRISWEAVPSKMGDHIFKKRICWGEGGGGGGGGGGIGDIRFSKWRSDNFLGKWKNFLHNHSIKNNYSNIL